MYIKYNVMLKVSTDVAVRKMLTGTPAMKELGGKVRGIVGECSEKDPIDKVKYINSIDIYIYKYIYIQKDR